MGTRYFAESKWKNVLKQDCGNGHTTVNTLTIIECKSHFSGFKKNKTGTSYG